MIYKNTQIGRRQFLKRSLILGAAPLTTMCQYNAGMRRVENIGLQLYTLRREMAQDFDGTLSRVAELGYQEVEFAGYFDKSALAVRSTLDRLGMTSPAAHIQLRAVRNNLEAEIEYAATLGQKYIVVPSLPGDERTLSHYQQHADLLNRAGEVCRNAGLKMGYHNHAYEFEVTQGRVPYDILLDETEPGLVDMELDLFWIIAGRANPVDYFENHPGRFAMLHVKDMARDGSMIDVGRGTIDFASLFSYADTAGFQHYFVEHDNPDNGLESVAYSIRSIRNLVF